jgi:aldose 1-epimerase
MEISLQQYGFHLSLLPALGGSVLAFTCNGQDILYRAAGRPPSNPLETAGFPLFPFSGRINEAKFQWRGREIRLEGNFLPEPHAIHGQAWLGTWQVDSLTAETARLSFDYEPGDWPWAYRAIQDFKLTPEGLHLTLSLENRSGEEMPAGLGWHPYFPRGDARLSANVSGIWQAEEGMIPDQLASLTPDTDLREERDVHTLRLDNAFLASPANARISWPSRNLHVSMRSSDTLGQLVVFVPEGKDFFCVEPVSHAPDAVNSHHEHAVTGLQTLGPGETLRAEIILAVNR